MRLGLVSAPSSRLRVVRSNHAKSIKCLRLPVTGRRGTSASDRDSLQRSDLGSSDQLLASMQRALDTLPVEFVQIVCVLRLYKDYFYR